MLIWGTALHESRKSPRAQSGEQERSDLKRGLDRRHQYADNAEYEESRKIILASIEQAERRRPGNSNRIDANLWQVSRLPQISFENTHRASPWCSP